ncbi:MAG: flippase-like domain-containing protein [Alphaproteobacteria bacterium]|nr:flippase-like domain-containing protein [Alphaproteobacteria bacterium]
MKLVSVAGAIAGLAVMGALVAYLGADAVIRSLSAIAWGGFSAVCLIHVVVIAAMGIAWRALVPAAPAWAFVWGRFVRDAGSDVLPFSPMAGCVLGARAVALTGVPGSVAAASTIADLTLEFFAKLVYTGLGLVLLVQLRPGLPDALPITVGLAVASLVAVALTVAQRHGLGLFERFARHIGRGWADRTAAGASAVHAVLVSTYSRKAGVWGGFLLHLACWIASALEVWCALSLAGMPLDFRAVLVIESLLYAIRTLAFAIPNAVGVQEGAYILLGATFGLTPEMALAISLLKRMRDLVIGLPVLAIWQVVEGDRLWRRFAPGRTTARPVGTAGEDDA